MSAFPNRRNNSRRTVDVYTPDFENVLTIPSSQVFHIPSEDLGVSRLVLCKNFEKRGDHCVKGRSCKFVHADVVSGNIVSHRIHVNYAWRAPELVKYERMPAGDAVVVAAPNCRAPMLPVEPQFVLRTRGSEKAFGGDAKDTPSHCAHYYFNRMCNRGAECNFIHAVHIDPTATEFQKAPSPAAATYAAQTTRPQHQHHHVPAAQQAQLQHPARVEAPRRTSASCCHHTSETDSVSDGISESGSDLCESPSVGTVVARATQVVYMYRHDPYSERAILVL